MRIQVEGVVIPPGSTVGFGFGTTDNGTVAVLFGGDHRAMSAIGESLVDATEPLVVDVPDWAILDAREIGR